MDKNINLHDRPVAQDTTFTLSEKEVQLEIKKNRIIRALYIIGGTISLALAILGIAVPGLPTTPLALLSAFLYAKSSPKLYNWLLSNKVLGPRIRNYQRRKGVTPKGKVGIITFMSIMVLFSSFVVVGPGAVRWVILSLGLIGGVVVAFFVPNAKGEG
nr:YbaN family protein [Proteiniphilum sp. UBA5384]